MTRDFWTSAVPFLRPSSNNRSKVWFFTPSESSRKVHAARWGEGRALCGACWGTREFGAAVARGWSTNDAANCRKCRKSLALIQHEGTE